MPCGSAVLAFCRGRSAAALLQRGVLSLWAAVAVLLSLFSFRCWCGCAAVGLRGCCLTLLVWLFFFFMACCAGAVRGVCRDRSSWACCLRGLRPLRCMLSLVWPLPLSACVGLPCAVGCMPWVIVQQIVYRVFVSFSVKNGEKFTDFDGNVCRNLSYLNIIHSNELLLTYVKYFAKCLYIGVYRLSW